MKQYEKDGKVAKDRQKEIWKGLGYDVDKEEAEEARKVRGYND